MTDGISAMYDDDNREDALCRFYYTLLQHLAYPSSVNVDEVRKAAAIADSTGSEIAKTLDSRIERLRNNDRHEWLRLLNCTERRQYIYFFNSEMLIVDLYAKCRAISPWQEEVLLSVQYTRGSIIVGGQDVQRLVAGLLKSRGLAMQPGDAYTFALGPLNVREILWEPNIYGPITPFEDERQNGCASDETTKKLVINLRDK